MDTLELLTQLVQIPAPSGREEKRAEYICAYLQKCGLKTVLDKAGNVCVEFKAGEGKYTVFSAHMDTVFEDEKITVTKNGSIFSAPGIGDDTANVVLLMKTLEDIVKKGLKPKKNVLAVFNVCEEGMGNLKGIRQIMYDYSDRVDEHISFDLTSDAVCVKAVGSKRYRVTVTSPGGHSFHAFGQKSAIETAANIIHEIYSIPVDNMGDSKTTYNVGTISGGTSVNTIAQECTFLAEVRSDDRQAMQELEQKFLEIFKRYDNSDDRIQVIYELVGDRPTGFNVPEEKQSKLIKKSADIIKKHTQTAPVLNSGSTDCNIPLSVGIPAVSFGGYKGGGAHTRQEWIDVSFMDTGYNIVSEFVESYFLDESGE